MIEENRRVLLGMSGGTDSSVAAMRLLEEGYEVVGVTFRFYDAPGSGEALEEARLLAGQLGMEHRVYDARGLFRREIVDYFVAEYMAGRTPVPCTLCNRLLKWPLLERVADGLGIFHIATGHYVRKACVGGTWYVAASADADKDQTFFLWGLGQTTLRRMLLPMGGMTKAEARQWAAAKGFRSVALRKDSTGVCFCPGDYRGFLRRRMEAGDIPAVGRGRFVDDEGRFLGWHEGYPFYTVGQRRGLGICLNRPVFVKEIRPADNTIVLSAFAALERTEMQLRDWNLVDSSRVLDGPDVEVKIRYRKQLNHGQVSLADDGLLHVWLREPLTAVAPGQAAAFYRDGLLLGGGIIV